MKMPKLLFGSNGEDVSAFIYTNHARHPRKNYGRGFGIVGVHEKIPVFVHQATVVCGVLLIASMRVMMLWLLLTIPKKRTNKYFPMGVRIQFFHIDSVNDLSDRNRT
mmetsp:Transcript_45110/g.45521  ORF Transcript_45110/g.45521 Transcript_45110/m.45521 type:complete len:107 (-) Transcript_45110:135-455(-)